MQRILIIHVAVAAPLPGLFDYLPPPGFDPTRLQKGVRLRVPFGRGKRIGFMWALDTESELPIDALKPAIEVLDEAPLLPQVDLDLLQWTAAYYQHPLGEVLNNALPAGLRKRTGAAKTEAVVCWRLAEGARAMDADGLARRAPRQAEIVERLRAHPHGLTSSQLNAGFGPSAQVLKRLREKGWVETCPPPREQAAQPVAGPALNPEQAEAVSRVSRALGGFQAFLLDGVTGSGKTEVYLTLIERVLADSGQVLLLVPEIGLTPQLQRRLKRRLRAPVALLHSGMSEGEREASWRQAREGSAGVLVGTRSAVFAPMPRLALILVDEEHDLSFKQQDGLRYSGRDIAVRRAQQRRCPVLLGSATPALEGLYNAQQGRYHKLCLSQRAGGASIPRLDLIDIRSVRLQAGLSPTLIRLLRDNLAAGGQSLLFLNRRGYAPILTCHDCGWVAGCPSCDARLTLHQASQTLWCHHCGYRHRQVEACPSCKGPNLLALGQGTERVETQLAELFKDVPVARIDRDSTRRRGSLERLLEDARAGRYPLLLGTQMLAKGHHFPDVTLVGILDLDQGLYGADYRATERMAQLLIQVAGRAGRADKPGRVALQTRHPEHHLLQTLIHRGYGDFAQATLNERRQTLLPPYTAHALLRAEAPDPLAPQAFLDLAVSLAGLKPAGVQFWGPVPAPMERRAGRYRAHLLLQSAGRPALQTFLAGWVPGLYRLKEARKVRWSVDVDPQDML